MKLFILIGIGCFIGLCITYHSAIVQVSLKKWYYQLSDNADFGLDTQDGNITSAKIRHKTANNNNRPILSVLRHGRLGNGMWQYSGLLGLANMTNRVPILNSGYRDIAQIFTLSTQIDSRINILKASTRYEQRQLFINVEETVENIRNISEDVTLKGYFQYFRFFSSVTETIRKEFQFRTIIKQQVSTFFKKVNLTDEKLIKVGIHIRRTDLNKPRQIKQGFGPPPTNYFINAMNFFRTEGWTQPGKLSDKVGPLEEILRKLDHLWDTNDKERLQNWPGFGEVVMPDKEVLDTVHLATVLWRSKLLLPGKRQRILLISSHEINILSLIVTSHQHHLQLRIIFSVSESDWSFIFRGGGGLCRRFRFDLVGCVFQAWNRWYIYFLCIGESLLLIYDPRQGPTFLGTEELDREHKVFRDKRIQ
ncbi:hypothetical protein LSH36_1399g00029 [Paralvinella palmiformis]|uniref:L-Fucosyltransferase n=1 Tax=Paralvinella palmiformis TaxID=53620 RepID=A0AAD9IU41_9ANNE|nr:hypothetical protein LSH36_1399g00029 [Paralvinella palmiformis]